MSKDSERNPINVRIKQVIDSKELNITSFARTIGISQQVIFSYIVQDRQPSASVLSKIALTFNDISMDWILTGTGKMNKDTNIVVNRSHDSSSLNPTIDRLLSIIESQQRTIENLSNPHK